MKQTPTVEDARGVDRSQIRRQLRMSVPERVRTMVHAANVMLSMQKSAQASTQPPMVPSNLESRRDELS